MLRRENAFTFVELLIVVAIIGVLSAVGIPAYRKLTQKSKQANAKLLLSEIYTAEQAFHAEYGAYGNHLFRLGVGEALGPLGAPVHTGHYDVGFPLGNLCAPGSLIMIIPSVAPYSSRIQQAFPSYYIDPISGGNSFTRAHTMFSNLRPPGGGLGFRYCYTGVSPLVPSDGSSFTASATGVIAPGLVEADIAADNTLADVWTLNDNRVLVNFNDGIR